MTKINLHTHSTFCDGKNTPEEMVLSALEKGFSVLGFSSHSMYPFSSYCHIPSNQHSDYVKAIRELAVKYQNRIKILCGFECDYFPPLSIPEKSHFGELKPDYLIGAVHYLVHNNMQATVDDATNKVQEGLERLYKGDGRLCVHDYYQAQRDMLKQGNFEIWAHPDLVRKRNGLLHFFDETEEWYKDEVRETVKVAAKTGVIAEINTGAIARGAMDDVYPSSYFLSLLHDAGIPVCISSDCHNAPDLDCAFDRAIQIAKKAGYKELVYPIAGIIPI